MVCFPKKQIIDAYQPPEILFLSFNKSQQTQINPHSYGRLWVITGYKWGYTLYKWGYKYL